jgi:peroxiredoxin
MKVLASSRVAVFVLTVLGLSVTAGLSVLHGEDESKSDVGSLAPITLPKNVRMYDLDGRQHVLLGTSQCRGVALVFLSTECPLCNEAVPRLNTLAASYKKLGIELFGVISDRSVTRLQAQEHHENFRIKFPMILDSVNALRELTGATHTPQAFVFDQAGKEIYRGRLDDSSERLGKKNVPKKNYLADALHAVAKRQRLAVSQTQAVGCLLEELGTGQKDSAVTFNREIAPIVFSNCVACHRDGEVAPFPLTNDEQVSKRANRYPQWSPRG